MSFVAHYSKDNDVQLDWTIASATNNDHMVVQHSLDGITWTDVPSCEIDGVGSTSQMQSFTCVHREPQQGQLNYYRLADVDYDGSVRYSAMQVVYVPATKVVSLSGSNLVQAGQTLEIEGMEFLDTYAIFNTAGVLVASQSGTSEIVAPRQAGMYILSISRGQGQVSNIKLIVSE